MNNDRTKAAEQIVTESDFALRGALSEIMAAVRHASTLECAFERAQEKISDLYKGRKTCRRNYVSIDSLIYVVTVERNITFEQAHQRWIKASEQSRQKHRQKVLDWEELYLLARKFDRENIGIGEQFVTYKAQERGFKFFFIDSEKNLEFRLDRVDRLRPELAAIGREILGFDQQTETLSDAEIVRIISTRICDITNWSNILVFQQISNLQGSEKMILLQNIDKIPKLFQFFPVHNQIPVTDKLIAKELFKIIEKLED